MFLLIRSYVFCGYIYLYNIYLNTHVNYVRLEIYVSCVAFLCLCGLCWSNLTAQRCKAFAAAKQACI